MFSAKIVYITDMYSEILNIDFLSQMPTCLSKYLPVYNNVKISTCLLPCLGVYLCLKD